MKQISNTVIALIIAVGVAGFFGGMKFQDYQTTKNRSQMGRQFMGQGGMMGGQMNQRSNRGAGGNRPVAGEILSIDDTSMTVKMIDGSSKIVILSEKSTINKATEGTKTDLKVGEKVSVFGTENADGSVTAASVQLNPMMRGPMGGSIAPTK